MKKTFSHVDIPTTEAKKGENYSVDMGRNVFQSEDPVAMIQAVSGVVHDGLSPKEGFEKFNDLKN
ncbi:MAG: hypothetical protein OEL75_02665 [Kiritimatiellaceae bacterium]|nr:hypothetical protein [Kiritimatiellaceae bacterium]